MQKFDILELQLAKYGYFFKHIWNYGGRGNWLKIMMSPVPRLLYPSFTSIEAIWNLTRPLTSNDLGRCPSPVAFHTRPCLGLLSPSFSSNVAIINMTCLWSWMTLNDTPFLCVSFPLHVQDYFHQVSTQSKQFEIWPDLWAQMT